MFTLFQTKQNANFRKENQTFVAPDYLERAQLYASRLLICIFWYNLFF